MSNLDDSFDIPYDGEHSDTRPLNNTPDPMALRPDDGNSDDSFDIPYEEEVPSSAPPTTSTRPSRRATTTTEQSRQQVVLPPRPPPTAPFHVHYEWSRLMLEEAGKPPHNYRRGTNDKFRDCKCDPIVLRSPPTAQQLNYALELRAIAREDLCAHIDELFVVLNKKRWLIGRLVSITDKNYLPQFRWICSSVEVNEYFNFVHNWNAFRPKHKGLITEQRQVYTSQCRVLNHHVLHLKRTQPH